MKFSEATTIEPVTMINVDTGVMKRYDRGQTLPMVRTEIQTDPRLEAREYYLVEGTRFGSVVQWWLREEDAGKLKLKRVAENHDPRLAGILLPIRDRKQLTEQQMKGLVCGHLVKGKFYCERCTLHEALTYPNAIAVYPLNIFPYSQGCFKCGLLIFDVWQRTKGGPLFLFT